MRTTVTLDDDVAAKLDAETRRTGRPFKDVINDALRRGLMRRSKIETARFSVQSRPMGIFPGLSYDNVEELLDRVEGPIRR